MENQTGNTQKGQPDGFHQSLPQNLPNANLILILGILSILLSWWHFVSVAGILLSFLALILANREFSLYNANPSRYTVSSLNNVKAGRTCAIIGLIISIIVFAFVMLLIFGILVSLPFWGMIR
jgi:hypothetical protein